MRSPWPLGMALFPGSDLSCSLDGLLSSTAVSSANELVLMMAAVGFGIAVVGCVLAWRTAPATLVTAPRREAPRARRPIVEVVTEFMVVVCVGVCM